MATHSVPLGTPTAPSSICADGLHSTCQRVQARCACRCHGGIQLPPEPNHTPRPGSLGARVLDDLRGNGPVADKEGRCLGVLADRLKVPDSERATLSTVLGLLHNKGLIDRRLNGRRCFEISLAAGAGAAPAHDSTPEPRPLHPVATPVTDESVPPQPLRLVPQATPATNDTLEPQPPLLTDLEAAAIRSIRAASTAVGQVLGSFTGNSTLDQLEDEILLGAARRLLDGGSER